MKKSQEYAKRTFTLSSAQEVLEKYLQKQDLGAHGHLTRLWDHWDMVMGEELTALAAPLGHSGRTLRIGAEDTMAAQELRMYSTEILERVNAFMAEPFFDRVQVELTMRRTDLSQIRTPQNLKVPPPPLARPKQLGALVGVLDPESEVGKSYQAYINYFKRLDPSFLP